MQERPDADFRVDVRAEELEHLELGADVAGLFAGIFQVSCNRVVTVTFIPEYRSADIVTIADWDAPASVAEARWCTAMAASIVVTPGKAADSPERADERTVFTVSSAAFEAWAHELRGLLDAVPEIAWRPFGGGGVPLSTLVRYGFMRFLLDHALRPPHVSDYALKMLCIERAR